MVRLLGMTFATVFAMLLLATRFMHAPAGPAPSGNTPTAAVAQSSPAAYDPWSGREPPPGAHSPSAAGRTLADTRLERDGSGQFHLNARINGRDAAFLVDTGADLVAIGEAEAGQLGITVTPDQFRPIMRTASGTGYGVLVRIDRLEVAGRELHDVPAVVMQGLATNLLGQSALKQLGKVELQGDRRVIKPV